MCNLEFSALSQNMALPWKLRNWLNVPLSKSRDSWDELCCWWHVRAGWSPFFTEDSTLPGVYCHVPSPLQSSDSSIRHHSLSPKNNRVPSLQGRAEKDAVEITVRPQPCPKALTSSFKPHTSSLSWHTSIPARWTLLKVSNRVSSELAKVEMRHTTIIKQTYFYPLIILNCGKNTHNKIYHLNHF